MLPKRFSRLLMTLVASAAPLLASAADTYTIGAVYPLTGGLSWLGEYYKKAAELQVDLLNQQGGINGHQLRLVAYDDQSTPEGAARAAQRALSRDGAIALVGTASVPMSGAVATVARENQVPAVISSGYHVDPAKDPFVFNSAHQTGYAVERPFKYFANTGKKNIALLMPVGPLGDIGITAAESAAAKHGLEIVASERFNPQSPDLTAQLASLRTRKPDAVFSFVTGESAAMVARNMQQIRFDVPLLVSHGNATPGFLKMVAPLNADIIVPSGQLGAPDAIPASAPNHALITEFEKAHQARYNEAGNYFSGMAADSILLVAEGLRKSKSTDGKALRDAIESIQDMPGYGGVYRMSAQDHHGTSADDLILLKPSAQGWITVE